MSARPFAASNGIYGSPRMVHELCGNGLLICVLDGTIFGTNIQHHRHQEFIRFLNALDREILPKSSST